MSVLIKGFTMPESCEECDLCNDDGYCLAMHGDSLWDALPEGAEYFPTGWKYEGCPIIEVPAPHGDLIDRDALNIGEYEREDDDSGTLEISLGGLLSLYHKVIDAPTVIEAEVME